MNIIIQTIAYKKMRYATAGDWQWKAGDLHISVARLGDWKMEACLALHELVEALLCKLDGVSQQQVDEFDMNFKGEFEPGDDPQCPYRRQHQIANVIERVAALALGVNWEEYEKRLDAL